MKKFIIFLYISTTLVCAQSQKKDPLQGNYMLGTSAEIALTWHSNKFSDSSVSHKVFNYLSNSGQYFIDSTNKEKFNENLGIGGRNSVSTLSADFDGDALDEIITAWEGSRNNIYLIVSEVNPNTFAWEDKSELGLEDVIYDISKSNFSDHYKLTKGNFDDDIYSEFAICFWNKEAKLEIRIYDLNETTLELNIKASIADEFMDPDMDENEILFDFDAGDFDGDLRDEIVLIGHRRIDQDNWSIFTKIYDYNEDVSKSSLIPRGKEDNFFTNDDFSNSSYRVNDILVKTGDFTNNTIDEFVVDFVWANKGSSQAENYLLPASVTQSLDTISLNKDNLYKIFQNNGNSDLAISLQTADLNNDGSDEIIADGDGRFIIYETDSLLKITKKASNTYGSYTRTDQRMVIADLNASTSDSSWYPEIIAAQTQYIEPDNSDNYSNLLITVFEPIIDASGEIVNLERRIIYKADSVKGSPTYYYSVTAGDYDGGSIRLGKPNYFSVTDIVQPMVILNAPPVHFDIIDNQVFDINKSFNGQSSEFFSKYYTASETDIEVSTKVHTGWTIGGKVEGGFSIPIVEIGVKAEIEGEYGKDFSKKTKNSKTYRVSQNITASSDDYIYATIIDYDIWEYPVIADEEIQGYILVVEPNQPQRSWFPSKSPQAQDYIPNHEVGNILSYNDIAAPTENGSLQQVLKWNTSDQITLDGSPGFEYNWALQNETQTEITETNEVHWEVKGKASFDIPFKFIPDVEINGSYSSNTITTRKNTVKYKKGLNVHLGPIDLGIGETYYSVTPYAYWAKSGALVLDYAVDPRPSGINIPKTWWQDKYSDKPDPALNLPWRLDPEKGFSISEDKRQQTKEILFSNENLKPGDVINIKTRINNYSLLNTNSIIDAKFYLGDPSNGGSLIQSVEGKTIFSTSDFIPARGSKIISFDWQVPNGISTFPRIYVVLDPDDKVDEIHENNNIGWKVLPLFDSTTDVKSDENLPIHFEVSQNYPNPFNPSTTIKYNVPSVVDANFVSTSKIELIVYDVLGREVKTLVNENQKPGSYQIRFDASNLSSGVYFYKLQSGDFVETKKMILLR
jgi:Secretion system C-terminal sorting domain/Clostridium epsilon toxin ETX/Bacillus mosquitocidal toxin MTX2